MEIGAIGPPLTVDPEPGGAGICLASPVACTSVTLATPKSGGLDMGYIRFDFSQPAVLFSAHLLLCVLLAPLFDSLSGAS